MFFFVQYFISDVLSDTEHEQDEGAVSETEAIPSGPRKVDCPEDEEFLSALDKMVSENIQERMRETVKATNIDISVPIVVRSNKKTYDQLQVSSVSIFYFKLRMCSSNNYILL